MNTRDTLTVMLILFGPYVAFFALLLLGAIIQGR
jgi:hypothetical protein